MQRPFIVLPASYYLQYIEFGIYCFFSQLYSLQIYNGDHEKHTIYLYNAFRHYVLRWL